MARYSGPEDVNDNAFLKMGDSYHEMAQEYLDVILEANGIDPTLLTSKNKILKYIAVLYAKEKYLDSKTAQSDAITEQLERIHRERRGVENQHMGDALNAIKDELELDSAYSTVSTARMERG